MCCERKEFEIFSCVRGKRLGKKQKEEKKSRLGREQKEKKKSSWKETREQKKAKSKKQKAFKKKSEKRKERHKKNFFSKDTKILLLFFALLSLEKIHLTEEKTKNAPRRLYEDSLRRESAEERER